MNILKECMRLDTALAFAESIKNNYELVTVRAYKPHYIVSKSNIFMNPNLLVRIYWNGVITVDNAQYFPAHFDLNN